jgi:hypothetical protein
VEKSSVGKRERGYLTSSSRTLDSPLLEGSSTKALSYSVVLESCLMLASGLPHYIHIHEDSTAQQKVGLLVA